VLSLAMQEATAVEVATPQLGHALHAPIVQEYATHAMPVSQD
jgi:hypothetical protein